MSNKKNHRKPATIRIKPIPAAVIVQAVSNAKMTEEEYAQAERDEMDKDSDTDEPGDGPNAAGEVDLEASG